MAEEVTGGSVASFQHYQDKLRKKLSSETGTAVVAQAPGKRELSRSPNRSGIAASLENAKIALEELGIVFRFNLFSQQVTVDGLPEGFVGPLGDIELLVRDFIIEERGFDPGERFMREAARLSARKNEFDPMLDHLNGLTWDGVPRLDTWLSVYLGAEDTPLTRAIGRAVLIAGVRRVRKPGAKFDYAMVLEGPQGGGKSTALKILAGGDEYFTDGLSMNAAYKEQQELLQGKWIVEIQEMSGLSRTEVQQVKQFLSKTHDRARRAYARSVEEVPRRCLLIGTTNDTQYLRDQTGNRRFWPVKTGKIDLAGLKEMTDQLWAEAAAAEREADDPITLPESLWDEAAKLQAERVEADPWEDVLVEKLPVAAKEVDGVLRISSRTILEKVLGLEPGLTQTRANRRLADCMRTLGWKGPDVFWLDGASVRGYTKQVGMAR